MKRFDTNEIAAHELAHGAAVRKAAPECSLFLKRNGDFPVQPCRVNLYGNGARRTIKGGKGSGDVNTRYSVSIEQGLQNAGFAVTTTGWMDAYDGLADRSVAKFWEDLSREAEENNTSPYILLMDRPRPPVSYDLPLDGDGELNLYVIARDASEGMDRYNIKGDYQLLDCEVWDILELAGRKEKFLLVLNSAVAVELAPVLAQVENILLLGQLGAETGDILADIVAGKAYPSGKLTATWAKTLSDHPCDADFGDKNEVVYHEGLYVGYRYFDTFGVEPEFGFGYGLGYTDFSAEPVTFDVRGNEVTMDVKVKNVGSFPGKEVIQAYCGLDGDAIRPARQLMTYAKTEELAPGEEETVSLAFDLRQTAIFDETRHAYVLRRGQYGIFAGNSLADSVCACFIQVPDEITVFHTEEIATVPVAELQPSKPCRLPDEALLGEKVVRPTPWQQENREQEIQKKIREMSDEELIRLCVGVLNDMTLDNNIGQSGKLVAGSAGETWSDEEITALSLADGPAGLRISPEYELDAQGRVKASQNALAGLLPGGAQKVESQGQKYYQYCTAIPVGTALAQSFNEALCQDMGRIVAEEMALFGVDIWLAPALNIQRHPLCGRNFEYYSEDPLLSGRIAGAITRGVQEIPGRSVTVKHFCANNQEAGRFFCNSVMSERTLREIYLRAFEVCIRMARPKALMTSYNLVNGTHTANSTDLLRKILRLEWGYEGLVMTDWLATGGMGWGEKFGPSTARDCISASNDLIMPGRPEDAQDIREGLAAGTVTRQHLESCAARVLQLSKEKKGLS